MGNGQENKAKQQGNSWGRKQTEQKQVKITEEKEGTHRGKRKCASGLARPFKKQEKSKQRKLRQGKLERKWKNVYKGRRDGKNKYFVLCAIFSTLLYQSGRNPITIYKH